MISWQRLKKPRKKFSELQVGIGSMSSITLVRCSKHWATRSWTAGENHFSGPFTCCQATITSIINVWVHWTLFHLSYYKKLMNLWNTRKSYRFGEKWMQRFHNWMKRGLTEACWQYRVLTRIFLPLNQPTGGFKEASQPPNWRLTKTVMLTLLLKHLN